MWDFCATEKVHFIKKLYTDSSRFCTNFEDICQNIENVDHAEFTIPSYSDDIIPSSLYYMLP